MSFYRDYGASFKIGAKNAGLDYYAQWRGKFIAGCKNARQAATSGAAPSPSREKPHGASPCADEARKLRASIRRRAQTRAALAKSPDKCGAGKQLPRDNFDPADLPMALASICACLGLCPIVYIFLAANCG